MQSDAFNPPERPDGEQFFILKRVIFVHYIRFLKNQRFYFMRGNSIFGYILILLLVLLLFGAISIGDILSVVFYIFLGIGLLVAAAIVIMRVKLARIKKKMESGEPGGAYYKTYTWGARGGRTDDSGKREGEVTVEQAGRLKSKMVSDSVGDYADYEEITESCNPDD